MKRLEESRQLTTSNDNSGTLTGDLLPCDDEPRRAESWYRRTTKRSIVSAVLREDTIVEEVRTFVRTRDV